MANEMTYEELKRLFQASERLNPPIHLTGYIELDDGYSNTFPSISRTYQVSSADPAFQPDSKSCAIIGNSLDGVDMDVRLDYLMADENGGEDGWAVVSCSLGRPPMPVVTKLDRPTFVGQLIDVFEDFLNEKEVEIVNPEKADSPDDAAIIYGSDYDDLAASIVDMMEKWGVM